MLGNLFLGNALELLRSSAVPLELNPIPWVHVIFIKSHTINSGDLTGFIKIHSALGALSEGYTEQIL